MSLTDSRPDATGIHNGIASFFRIVPYCGSLPVRHWRWDFPDLTSAHERRIVGHTRRIQKALSRSEKRRKGLA